MHPQTGSTNLGLIHTGFNWIAKHVERMYAFFCAQIFDIIFLSNASLITRNEHRVINALDRASERKISGHTVSFDQVIHRGRFGFAVLDRNNIRPVCLRITVLRTNLKLVFPPIKRRCVPAVGVE